MTVITNQLVIQQVRKNRFYHEAMGRKPHDRRDAYGAWLCHLRKEKGLSQDALSAKTGIPQSTLAYWENTGKLTGREVILALASALGVSVEELLRTGKQKKRN